MLISQGCLVRKSSGCWFILSAWTWKDTKLPVGDFCPCCWTSWPSGPSQHIWIYFSPSPKKTRKEKTKKKTQTNHGFLQFWEMAKLHFLNCIFQLFISCNLKITIERPTNCNSAQTHQSCVTGERREKPTVTWCWEGSVAVHSPPSLPLQNYLIITCSRMHTNS